MRREELIQEIRLSIKSKRPMEVASVGAIEVNGKLIAIKSRYEKEDTDELLKDRNNFVVLDKVNRDFDYDYKDIHAKNVIYDRSIFNRRGIEALKELEKFV